MIKRAGTFRTNLTGEAAYRSFVPSPLPPETPLDMNAGMAELLAKASRQLGVLETLAGHIPSINLFISMYVRKEALLSSQIEGTQATLEDILDPAIDKNANLDTTEVIKYIAAAEYAIHRMKTLPLCNRLLKETHAVLMEGSRGQEKAPGEFRRSQNWIGGHSSTIKTARYIPPEPSDMNKAISSLEKYINSDDGLDVLIRAALIHYQFETIHPFLDGNGRIGRLLIILFLMEKGILTKPSLYISCFLKKNRVEYYDRLMEVRNKGNYEQWVMFFLEAIYESAVDAVAAIEKLAVLHKKNNAVIETLGRGAKTALTLFEYLEEHPIINIKKTAADLKIAFNTVSDAVKRLCTLSILTQAAGTNRDRTFVYREYLEILRKDT
jgi:Fic family protein